MVTGVYRKFPMAAIRPPPDPARHAMDTGKLGDLADSIAAEGLHQPVGLVLDVDGDGATLAWGHRRLLAHRLLRAEYIDAKVFPHGTDLELARWSENGQRDDLNPLEEAGEVRRFLDRGYPLAHISRMFRRSEAWTKDRLALLELPDDLKACITDKSLPLAVVSVLRDVDHAGYRESLIREAVANGATSAVAEVWRAHYLAERTRIISNHVTVEQMIAERASFVITVPCEWCGEAAPIEKSRTWRLCDGCHVEVSRARAEAMPQNR